MGPRGLTLVEMIVLVAVLGVVFTLVAFNGQRTLAEQEEVAFLRTLQGLFWQGATEAASRGETLLLVRQGNRLEIRRGQQALRSVRIPSGISLSLAEGTIVQFTPPGKLQGPQGQNLTQPLTFTVQRGNKTFTYTISLIGEAKVIP